MSELYFNHSALEGIENDQVSAYLKELLMLARLVKENNYVLRFSDRLWDLALKRNKLSNYMYDMNKSDEVKPFLLAATSSGPYYNEVDVEERLFIVPSIQSGTSPERILYRCLNDSHSLVLSLINEPLLIENKYEIQSSKHAVEVSNIIGETQLKDYFRSEIAFKTIDDVFDKLEEMRPDIIILESAKKSAKLHNFYGNYNQVYDTLVALAETELSLLGEGVNDEIRKREFYKFSGFEISGESSKTMQKTTCVRQREFNIPERGKVIFEWHVKIGTKTRIHYYLDLESRNVYIGHCGKHLKT